MGHAGFARIRSPRICVGRCPRMLGPVWRFRLTQAESERSKSAKEPVYVGAGTTGGAAVAPGGAEAPKTATVASDLLRVGAGRTADGQLTARRSISGGRGGRDRCCCCAGGPRGAAAGCLDRKSTRLNSSHANISYAVFC